MRHRKIKNPESIYTWNNVSQVEQDGDELGLCWIGEAEEGELRNVMEIIRPGKGRVAFVDQLLQELEIVSCKSSLHFAKITLPLVFLSLMEWGMSV